MRWFSALGMAALAAMSAAEVPSLTTKDFFSVIDNAPGPVLVKFFAPWCGHCKKLAPKYEAASEMLVSQNVTLAEVDCTVNPELCLRYEVRSYPSLKIFEGGDSSKKPVAYGGTREIEGIFSYMIRYSLPVVTELKDASDIIQFRNRDRAVIVAVLDEGDTERRELVESVASANRDAFLVGIAPLTQSTTVGLGVTQTPHLCALRNFDGHREDYEGDWSFDSIAEFGAFATTPLIEEIVPENFMRIASTGRPIAFIFMPPDAEYHGDVLSEFGSIAKKYRNDVTFVWINAITFKDHANALGLSEQKWPALAIQDVKKRTKYPFPQDQPFQVDAVDAFVDKFIKGGVAATIRSEPAPESQDEDVIVVVANTFDSVAQDTSKNTLLEFYAPWCGHCKKLKPTYDELAAHYKDASDVVIAKYDGAANDFPDNQDISVSGFPTIYFRPRNSKRWIEYSGTREFDDLVAFVDNNAVHDSHDEL